MSCQVYVNEIQALQKKTGDSDILGILQKLETKYNNPNKSCKIELTPTALSDTLNDFVNNDVDKLDKLMLFIDENKNVSPELNKLLNTPLEGGKTRRRRRHGRKSRKHGRKSRRHRRKSRRHRK